MVDTHQGNANYYKADQLQKLLNYCDIKPDPPGPPDLQSYNKPVEANLPDLDTLTGSQLTAVNREDANTQLSTGKT